MHKVSVKVTRKKSNAENAKVLSKQEFDRVNPLQKYMSVRIPYVSIIDIVKRQIANPTTWCVYLSIHSHYLSNIISIFYTLLFI